MMLAEYPNHALTACARRRSMAGDTPAMPLHDAHFGGFFVAVPTADAAKSAVTSLRYSNAASNLWGNNTRQGYALQSTLKPAGCLFLNPATLLFSVFRNGISSFPRICREGKS